MSDLSSPSESSTHSTTAARPFACKVRSNGRAAKWIDVCGELDQATAQRFEQTLQEALSSALLVIIDLRDLTLIDSTGLSVITEADARARRSGRRLVVVRGPAQTDRVLELLGLSPRLEIIDLRLVRRPAPSLSVLDALDAA